MLNKKVAISSDFLTLAGAAGLGTPASGSSSRRRARASFYLRLPTIRSEPCWFSHKHTLSNKKTLHKGELFYWLQEDAEIKEKSAQLYNVLVNHYNEILAMKDQVKLIKSLLDA